MSFNVGSLVAYLQLDDTEFSRKAVQADTQINDLRAHLTELAAARPHIKIEIEAKTAELDTLQARLTELQAQGAEGVNVRVDIAETLAKIAIARREIRALQYDAATPPMGRWGQFGAELGKLGSQLSASPGTGAVIFQWVVALLPLLSSGVTGIVTGLMTMAGAAMFAFGNFAAGAFSAVSALAVLKLGLSGISSAVSAYTTYLTAMSAATTASQRRAATAALNQSSYGQLSAEGQGLIQTIAGPGASAFHQAQAAAVNGMAVGTTSGLMSIIQAAPMLNTVIGQISGALGTMVAKAGAGLKDPFWQQWFAWFGQTAAKDVGLFGTAFGRLFTGLAQGLQTFRNGEGRSFAQWLADISFKFERWTGSPQFSAWLTKLRDDARKTVQGFKDFSAWLKDAKPYFAAVIDGLNSTASVYWTAFADAMKVIAMLPPGVFQVLAQTLPTIFLAMRAAPLLGAVATGLGGIATRLEAFSAARVKAGAADGVAEVTAVENAGKGFAKGANPAAVAALGVTGGIAIASAMGGVGDIAKYNTGNGAQQQAAIKDANQNASAAVLGLIPPDAMAAITNGIAWLINGSDNDWSIVAIFTKQIPHAWSAYVVPFFTKNLPDWLRTAIAIPIDRWFFVELPGFLSGIGDWLRSAIVDPVIGFFTNLGAYVGDIAGRIGSWFLGIWNAVASKIGPVLAIAGIHIPGYANGTPDAPGGLAWVGEHGPELVNLPRHSQVFTASESKSLGRQIVVNFTVEGNLVDTTKERLEAMLIGAVNKVIPVG